MTTLYGIKNCDTIKKARRWLTENEVEYRFHDVRVDGLNADMIQKWIAATDWEVVLNKRGTTWRKLPEDIKNGANANNVVDLLLDYPAMIKRPILDTGSTIEIGFKESRYTQLFC